jgi:hypothetical protein
LLLKIYSFNRAKVHCKTEKSSALASTNKTSPPIYFIFNKDKRLEIREGKSPYGIRTDKRITRRLLKAFRPVVCKPNPITVAMKYQKIYNDSAYQSMEKVAQEFGVSRVRIHQMLNLLKLDERIINYIIDITNPRQNTFWTERRLRQIAQLPSDKQYPKFQRILTQASSRYCVNTQATPMI